MPTKKKRVGFIPRSDVLDIVNKLSFESNLSISKIINILIEEALYKRGIFNIKNGKVLNYKGIINRENNIRINKKIDDKIFFNESNNFINADNKHIKESNDEFIDNEIYEKFLIFLQFQEKMKNRN